MFGYTFRARRYGALGNVLSLKKAPDLSADYASRQGESGADIWFMRIEIRYILGYKRPRAKSYPLGEVMPMAQALLDLVVQVAAGVLVILISRWMLK